MSVKIDSVDDMKELLSELDLKVTSMDELKDLLQFVNDNYNPEEDQISTARSVMMTIPIISFGAAGTIAFFMMTGSIQISLSPQYMIAIIGITFGAAMLATLFSTLFGFHSINHTREDSAVKGSGLPRRAADEQPSAIEGRANELNITLPKERI